MRAKTLIERISHFNAVHTEKYDYSLLKEPIRWDSKIEVVCPKHGAFTTLVNNHARGAGCIKCSHTYQPTRAERIEAAVKVHGDKYNYSMLPDDIKASTVVSITCPDHGTFCPTIANHINHGSGCPVCANAVKRTNDKFIRQASAVHGNRYGYKHYDEVRGYSKISIICSLHGEFEQTVDAHLAGKGCQSCGSHSVDMNEAAVVYILKTDGMFKVGVTSRFNNRMVQLYRSTPFSFNVAYVREFKTRKEAFASESEILSIFPSAGLTGFDGATEWLIGDPCIHSNITA